MREPTTDVLDLRELAASVVRGWRWVLAGAVLGVAIAVAAVLALPPTYEGEGRIVLQDQGASPASALLGAGQASGLFSLPGRMGSDFSTQLEILTSRQIQRRVVDELGLQVQVMEPTALPVDSLFSAVRISPDIEATVLTFEMTDGVYAVEGQDGSSEVAPGQTWNAPGISLTVRPDAPSAFEIRVIDLNDALAWVESHLEAANPAGNVAELGFRAPNPVTAATVPNRMMEFYLAEKRGREEEFDQERLTVVESLTDSVRTELVQTGGALRRHHERTGTFDPTRLEDVERAGELAAEADRLEVELATLDRIVGSGAPDTLTVADLAAFPTFLRNPAVNDLLDRLLDLHEERSILLQRRTPEDPDVVGLTENIRFVEDQLLALARSYRDNVIRSLEGVAGELQRYRSALESRPAEKEAEYTLESEVDRLTAAYVALQSELVQARLATVQERETRIVDAAMVPTDPVFPRPRLFLALGLLGGVLMGVLGAVMAGQLRDRVSGVRQVAAATGVPAAMFTSGRPMLLGGVNERATILVIPVGVRSGSREVARSIARTAVLRGTEVAVLDLSTSGWLPSGTSDQTGGRTEVSVDGGGSYPVYPPAPLDAGGGGEEAGATSLRATLRELEERFPLVVVAVPGVEEPETAALVDRDRHVILVATAAETGLRRLTEVTDSLQALGITMVGVVVRNGSPSDDRP